MLLGEGGTLRVGSIEDVSSKEMVSSWLLILLLLLPYPHVPHPTFFAFLPPPPLLSFKS